MADDLETQFTEDLGQLVHEYEDRGLDPETISDSLDLYSQVARIKGDES